MGLVQISAAIDVGCIGMNMKTRKDLRSSGTDESTHSRSTKHGSRLATKASVLIVVNLVRKIGGAMSGVDFNSEMTKASPTSRIPFG
jgi:hypothetical protein